MVKGSKIPKIFIQSSTEKVLTPLDVKFRSIIVKYWFRLNLSLKLLQNMFWKHSALCSLIFKKDPRSCTFSMTDVPFFLEALPFWKMWIKNGSRSLYIVAWFFPISRTFVLYWMALSKWSPTYEYFLQRGRLELKIHFSSFRCEKALDYHLLLPFSFSEQFHCVPDLWKAV